VNSGADLDHDVYFVLRRHGARFEKAKAWKIKSERERHRPECMVKMIKDEVMIQTASSW